MNIHTAWVSPPQSSGGLDHLGAQAPCIQIYGRLLPGITNVTDRARYYSFYPWLIWSLEQRFPAIEEAQFVELFRRADCLFTLIAEHHGRAVNERAQLHGAGMVGRQKLVAATQQAINGQTLDLASYADRQSPLCYFKNRMGGLSQYYAGTLAELGVLDGDMRPWYRYSADQGKPLAQAMDQTVPGDAFWALVVRGTVSGADFAGLHAFCPCQLRVHDSEERRRLADLFFNRDARYGEAGEQRKRSLKLMAHLIHHLPPETPFTEQVFRGAVYGASLPDATPWTVPADLEAIRVQWSVYVRNDMLAVALHALFSLALRKLAPQSAADLRRYDTIEQLAQAFAKGPAAMPWLNAAGTTTFDAWQEQQLKALRPTQAWCDPDHELALAGQLVAGWGELDNTVLLATAMQVITILAVRGHPDAPYAAVDIDWNELGDYPLNLETFGRMLKDWQGWALQDVLADLVCKGLVTHLRIALRKLHATGRSTFQFHVTEQGLRLAGDSIVPPSRTTPRFYQALQILQDIGAVERDATDAAWLTASGAAMMELA